MHHCVDGLGEERRHVARPQVSDDRPHFIGGGQSRKSLAVVPKGKDCVSPGRQHRDKVRGNEARRTGDEDLHRTRGLPGTAQLLDRGAPVELFLHDPTEAFGQRHRRLPSEQSPGLLA